METQALLLRTFKKRLEDTRRSIASLERKISERFRFYQLMHPLEFDRIIASCDSILWKIHHLRGNELIHLYDLICATASAYVIADLTPKRGRDKKHTWHIFPISQYSPMQLTHRGIIYMFTVQSNGLVAVHRTNQSKNRRPRTYYRHELPQRCGPHAQIMFAKDLEEAEEVQNYFSENNYRLHVFTADSAAYYIPPRTNS